MQFTSGLALGRLRRVRSTSAPDPAALVLARFAAGLRLDAVPASVQATARHAIVDTLGVALHGATLPWSRIVAAQAQRYGAGGACTLLGTPGLRVHAPSAALAHGAFAHAFEQDNLRRPGAGVHPGAAILPAALAMAEEVRASGAQLLTAFIAAVEVMFRIGAASRHSSEALGFHAPGLTGPYGAAVAAGLLLGLDAGGLARALGIAGSLGGGLLAFAHADDGAMVKRLHLGRAAESGVLAARLAADGFDGPSTVLEGRHGFLETYCREADPQRLTAGLGQDWETARICFKAYPCHVTAQAAVQALRGLMATHGFDGGAIATLRLTVGPKVLSHHAGREPADLMQGQYSLPFCVALAAHRDPADPCQWDDAAAADPQIRALCRAIELVPFDPGKPPDSAWHVRLQLRLRDGRGLEADARHFRGMPEQPLDASAVADKFRRLASRGADPRVETLLDGLMGLEHAPDLGFVALAAQL